MKVLLRFSFVALLLFSTGCSTYRTVSSIGPGSPRVYSGVRLDYHTIRQNQFSLSRFEVEPPAYPWIDLPFSFMLDTVLVPLTLGSALAEKL